MLLEKLIALANKLDERGFYKEAEMIDKLAIEYPHDFSPPSVEPPEEWEAELMNMEISPEAVEKEKEYKKHMVPTDPSELEELSDKKMVEKKVEQGYDTDTDLLLRMQNVLKKFDDWDMASYYDDPAYEDDPTLLKEREMVPASEMDAKDKPKYRVDVGDVTLKEPEFKYRVDIGDPILHGPKPLTLDPMIFTVPSKPKPMISIDPKDIIIGNKPNE